MKYKLCMLFYIFFIKNDATRADSERKSEMVREKKHIFCDRGTERGKEKINVDVMSRQKSKMGLGNME